jgi:hypothetical protein
MSTAKFPRPHLFSKNGELGVLMRAYDWSSSPLGLPEGWAIQLRTLVAVMLGSRQPMFVVWGPARTLLYNDARAQGVVGSLDAINRNDRIAGHRTRHKQWLQLASAKARRLRSRCCCAYAY